MMKSRIYIFTHKQYDMPEDEMFRPIFVGAANHPGHFYLGDDSGDNISALNKYYSELTGLYWIWKNDKDAQILGTAHYRRYLINPDTGRVFSEAELDRLLMNESLMIDRGETKCAVPEESGAVPEMPRAVTESGDDFCYDMIATKQVLLNNSYRDGFKANHNVAALDAAGLVIKEKYPEYYDTYVRLVNGPRTYFGNLFIMRRALFMEYCEWLFEILAGVGEKVNLDTDEDDYHKRVLGFISEFLLTVWSEYKGLKVLECMVGMVGEKAEVTEMKNQLALYFSQKDYKTAKAYFLSQLEKRPDVLMEASDITGELHLCMQIIATAALEAEIGSEGQSYADGSEVGEGLHLADCDDAGNKAHEADIIDAVNSQFESDSDDAVNGALTILDRVCDYNELIHLFGKLNADIAAGITRGDDESITKAEIMKDKNISEIMYEAARRVVGK